MNRQDEDKIIGDLYQQGNQDLPPKALDDLILKHAQQSNMNNSTITGNTKNNWRPWLAAASVVLVIPMIWLLTQNEELSQGMEQLQSLEVQPIEVQDATPKTEAVFADEAGMEAESMEQAEFDEQDFEEQGKITVTGSRIRQEPTAAPMVDLQEIIEEQGQRSISGKPIDRKSVQTNKELLMNEFTVKKRSIKPSTMSPLMALEYEQFGRYLEQGEIEAADHLLTEMQENWPEYDFEDMVYRLAAADAAN